MATYFFLFILGMAVGSFLNVVGLRWGNRSFGGRSACPSCSTTLRWFELVPIISFLVLRGRCRTCQTKISWQYFLIELWTGLVFVSVFMVINPIDWLSAFYYLLVIVIFCIYIVILIYDFHHKIIPDELVYTSIVLSFFIPIFFTHYSPFDWLAGPILFAFFASLWFFSRGRAMGFGDAKLGLSVGLLLGAEQGFSAIILAFWIGAIVSIIILIFNKLGIPAETGFIKKTKGLTMKSEVPFAPAIILGAWISLAFQLNILNVGLF